MRPTRTQVVTILAILGILVSPLASQAPHEVVFESQGLDARTKDLLSRYAHQVRTWGLIQRVAQAAIEGNADVPAAERIAEMDARWREGRAEQLYRDVLESECSQGLQTLLAGNAGYADAFVLALDGRVVCMSRRTARYDYGEIPGWEPAVSDGNLWVSTARPTENAELERIEIVVPVLSRGEVVGGLVVGKLIPKI